MLAIQRPSMGSSKPGDLDMPFGYSFDSTSNFPFPSPPSAAPGPSLLDDSESKYLESFFDNVNSEHFDFNMFTNGPDAAESGFGWDELPPTFMGTTSSFGQQPHLSSHDQPEVNFDSLPSLPHTTHTNHTNPPLPSSTSAEVLAAATVLQNGAAGQSQSFAESSILRPEMALRQTNGHVRPQSISQYPPPRPYATQNEPPSNDYMRDNFYAEMVFGHPESNPARLRNANQKLDIRWGSDASFGTPQGFMAPHNHDTISEVENAQRHCIESAFHIDHDLSAENSQPPSPITAFHQPRKTESNSNLVEGGNSRPKKRRKSKIPDDRGEENESPPTPQIPEPKKRKTVKKDKDVDAEPGHKRRKSTAASIAAGKAARENLTEDQKRENHIRSEQKRRTLIREGFEDLGELVPGLRGGGFSKSAVLIMAADWLEDLLQGNEVLKERIERMEGR